jgi:hypothetical protein
MKKWESLLLLVDANYTNSIKHALVLNNTAHVINEYSVKDSAKRAMIIPYLQSAIVMLLTHQLDEEHVAKMDKCFEEPSGNILFAPHAIDNVADVDREAFVVILLNYFRELIKKNSAQHMHKLSTKSINFFHYAVATCSYVKSKHEAYQLVDFPVFTCPMSELMKVNELKTLLLSNATSMTSFEQSMKSKGTADGEGGDDDDDDDSEASNLQRSLTSASLKEEEGKRKLAAIKKRKELYDLIHSGQITSLYDAVAKNGASTKEIEKYLK